MASSGYTAISFVANEQPTTAKWNLIGSNDASFNNGNGFEDGIIVSRHFATKAVPASALPTNSVAQVVEQDFSNLISSTGTIPYDNTIPQIGEGFEVMTASITPLNAANNLLVEAEIYGSLNGGAGELSAALFRDANANALAADSVTVPANGYLANVRLRVKVAAGSTTATTFRVRIGAAGTQNVAFNGFANAGAGSGTQVFSTAAKSSIKITETVG